MIRLTINGTTHDVDVDATTPLLQRDAERRVLLLVEERAGRWNGGRGADRRMASAGEEPRDHAGELLFLGVRTHSSK